MNRPIGLIQILAEFDETQAEAVKTIEATTNHDVKAVEYFLKEALKDNSGAQRSQRIRAFWLHQRGY